MKKRIFNLCLAMIIGLLGTLNFTATAATLGNEVIEEKSSEEEVLRYVPCPVGAGKHAMRPKGWGWLYEGPANGNHTLVFEWGAMSQCQYCYLVVVSQCDPDLGLLGTYAFDSPGYEITTNMTNVYKYADEIHYNSSLSDDPIFAGFEWSRVK